MKCSKCKRLLVEYSDKRLDDILREEVEIHISNCDACRQELAGFQASLGLISDLRDHEVIPPAPEDFSGRVMDRIHQERRFSGIRKLVFAVAVVCCLLAAGAGLIRYAEFREKEDINTSRNNPVADTPEYIMKQKMVRMLDQTLEAIERGEREWEVEI